MENVWLQMKVIFWLLIIIMAAAIIGLSLMIQPARWQSLALLTAGWWFALAVMALLILGNRHIGKYVARVHQHQKSGAKGYISVQVHVLALLLAVIAIAIYMYGPPYLAIVRGGTHAESLAVGSFTVLVFAAMRVRGYHRLKAQSTKTDTVKHQPISILA